MNRIVSEILLLLLLCSCPSTPLEINVADAASLLHGGITFVDIMSDMDTAGICRIFALTDAEVAYAAGYVSTGATAEEVFVIEAVEGQADAVNNAIDAHMDYMIDGYSDYGPDEVPKLKNAVRETHGNYIFLCVCDEPAQAKTVIAQIVGK